MIRITRSDLENSPKPLGNWKLYKKKPVVIAARKMEEEFIVETIEGDMKGKAGDYLIEGVEGELYPCDEQIFHKTYEDAEP